MLLNVLGNMQIELGPAKVPEAGLYLYASRIMNKCLAARQPPEKKKIVLIVAFSLKGIRAPFLYIEKILSCHHGSKQDITGFIR